MWLLQRCKQARSDLQPTHAPIKKTAHGRYLGQAYLAYTTRMQIHVSSSCSSRRLLVCEVVSSTYTRYQAGTQHVEDILDRLRLAKNYAQAIFFLGGEVSYHTQNRERHSARRANNLHNPTLFADRNQRLNVTPPNALHTAVAYRMCSRKPR